MVSVEIVIKNSSGFDSKSAAMFIQKASNYISSIWIEKDERKANAKSLLGLLALGVGPGAKVTLIANGEDEEKAIQELEMYINSGGKASE